jgi:hypothetical protein
MNHWKTSPQMWTSIQNKTSQTLVGIIWENNLSGVMQRVTCKTLADN